jgi:hypothetical protein
VSAGDAAQQPGLSGSAYLRLVAPGAHVGMHVSTRLAPERIIDHGRRCDDG